MKKIILQTILFFSQSVANAFLFFGTMYAGFLLGRLYEGATPSMALLLNYDKFIPKSTVTYWIYILGMSLILGMVTSIFELTPTPNHNKPRKESQS